MIYNTELHHYGVQGMKWGIRKASHYDIRGVKRGIRKASNNKNTLSKKQKIGMNAGTFVASNTARILLNKTNISSGQKEVLSILAGEVGGATVGKTMGVNNRKLVNHVTADIVGKGISKATSKALESKTEINPISRFAISRHAGNIGKGTVERLLNGR